MAYQELKMTLAGDRKADEVMRKVRKDVVSSIITSAPRISAAQYLNGKEPVARVQK